MLLKRNKSFLPYSYLISCLLPYLQSFFSLGFSFFKTLFIKFSIKLPIEKFLSLNLPLTCICLNSTPRVLFIDKNTLQQNTQCRAARGCNRHLWHWWCLRVLHHGYVRHCSRSATLGVRHCYGHAALPLKNVQKFEFML